MAGERTNRVPDSMSIEAPGFRERQAAWNEVWRRREARDQAIAADRRAYLRSQLLDQSAQARLMSDLNPLKVAADVYTGEMLASGIGAVGRAALSTRMRPGAVRVPNPGYNETMQARALEAYRKAAEREVSRDSLHRVFNVAKNAERNIKYDTTIWPRLHRSIPRITKGVIDESEIVGDALTDLVMAGPKAVAMTYKANTYLQRAAAGAVFPQPTSVTMKVLREALFAGSAVAADYGAYKGVETVYDRRNRKGAEESRGGAAVGVGDALADEQRASQTNAVSVAESLQRGTDAWVLADARARLQAAGPSNETARAEFNARVKGIRDKAFRRKYAEWNNGANIDFELRVLRERPDAEWAGETRARHQEAVRRFGELSPDEWIPKEGGM